MEIITFLTSVITDRLSGLFKFFAKEFGEETLQIINNRILEYQIEEYKRNYKTKTLLHRIEPKKLLDFYHPLHIRRYSSDNRKKALVTSTDLARELFHNYSYLTLIGNAGSGKSTIVKYLFINAYDSNFKIPITIELRYLNDFPGTLIDYIKEKIFKVHKLASNDRIIDRLLSSGQFVFFLDGYDEIAFHRKQSLTKEINELVAVYFRNYYLLTSRPFAQVDLFPHFHNFEVCNLNDEDIDEFIKKQIPEDKAELSNKIIVAVNNQENRVYKGFLNNPLLLSMFILTFQSYSNIPQRRSDFFYQVFDTLFSVHDSMSKMAFVREKESGLPKEGFIEVLKIFSFLSYFEDKFIFPESYIYTQLNAIKERRHKLIFDNEKLIRDLQVAIGILIKDGIDYSFPHRALQEYFAAFYVASLNSKNKKIIYSKIFEPLFITESTVISLRDNFFIILFELDKLNLIEFGLIPFLRRFYEIDLNNLGYEKIFSYYNRIFTTFNIFKPVLQSISLQDFSNNLPNLINKYTPVEIEAYNTEHINDIKPIDTRIRTQVVDQRVQKRIANDEAKEFFKLFSLELKNKIIELENFLLEESKSDEDTISLILN